MTVSISRAFFAQAIHAVPVFGDFGGLLHVVISAWQSFDGLQLVLGCPSE